MISKTNLTNNTNGRRYLSSVKRLFSSKDVAQVLSIAPSLLASDFSCLNDELRRMLRAKCYWAHLDIMDGHFVPNITFGPQAVQAMRSVSSRLFLDTHLMIENPLKYLEAFVEAGSDLITIHAETVPNLSRAISAIRRSGVKVGVSIKPKTPLKTIESILGKVDMVLIMTVEPGFGGQGLLPNTLNKVRQLAQLRERKGYQFLIQVDGGINLKTASVATCAGANILVAGTAVFQGKSKIKDNIDALVKTAMGN